VPFHYIGADLGNGIFIDANFNISLDILKLLKLKNVENLKITEINKGFIDKETNYLKKGNKITIHYSGLFSSDTKIKLHDKGATFKGGLLSSDQDVIVEENQITYDPHGMFGSWHKSYIQQTESGAKIPGFWKDLELIQVSDDKVKLGNMMSVKRRGNKILIKVEGMLFDKEFTLMRSANRVVFLNEDNEGFRLDLFGNPVKKIKYMGRFGVGKSDSEYILSY
jgi:hypothetical protein